MLNIQWIDANAIKNLSALILVSVFAVGCASVPEAKPVASEMSKAAPSSKSRAESVFLYQSRVANAYLDQYPLMEIYGDVDPSVVAAETHMMESCSPLTQAILTRVEGVQPSIGLRLQVLWTIGECEQAAQKMDRLLTETALAGSI